MTSLQEIMNDNEKNTAQSIIERIDRVLEECYVPRERVGLSEFGIVKECPRKFWYLTHGFKKSTPPGRILRLFRSGNDIEDNIVNDLRKAGYYVYYNQLELKYGYFTGHIDGVINGREFKTGALLECKSSNLKKFKELLKVGYEAWNQVYKAQIHIYAKLLKTDKIFVVVECKDNSERYGEIIKTNTAFADEVLEMATDVINAEHPPIGIDNFICNWCEFKEDCKC